MNQFGLIRVAAIAPTVQVGNPQANGRAVLELAHRSGAEIVVAPELCLTGYTCRDLFSQKTLLDAAFAEMLRLCDEFRGGLLIVGLPIRLGNAIFNCAAVIQSGEVLGIVPKQFIPTYKEFEEARWFSAARGAEPPSLCVRGKSVPFGTDLLFRGVSPGRDSAAVPANELPIVGIEICEDGWMPNPPSSMQALAGATILCNLSASNEIVGKGAYRKHVVVQSQSGRCIAAYVYACSAPSESTTDVVMAGDCMIAENGAILSRVRMTNDAMAVADVDIQRLRQERQTLGTFGRRMAARYRTIDFTVNVEKVGPVPCGLRRTISATPFVPASAADLAERCETIFEIQCLGLAKRIAQLPPDTVLNIGISGGLDSTLAFLAAVQTFDSVLKEKRRIRPLTMPGFGTSERTRNNAERLVRYFGLACDVIDIRPACLQIFRDQGYSPFGLTVPPQGDREVEQFSEMLRGLPPDRRNDLGFENVQARVRTLELFSKGFVLGTGDLSELALGWCTYNGDHMSSYNVNCSIPKTLVKFLVEWVAKNRYEGTAACEILLDIAGTTISPELLPVGEDGAIQSTEAMLGPYILHDFFLYHFVRNGFSPEKILFLAANSPLAENFPPDQIRATLRTFVERFFQNQFKRNAVPDGPKVGTVSLSPRGDWRMPSDADPTIWLGRE